MKDPEGLLERAMRAEQRLVVAERKLREQEQLAPALEVLKSLTDAARARADRLEAELRQARAELHLAQAAPDFQKSPTVPLYDPETGLPGAALMERYLDYALVQARRYKRKMGLVVVRPRGIGTDQELIERLKAAIRSSDVLGRREGDYLLLLSEVRGKQDLAAILRRLQRSLMAGEAVPAGVGGALAPGEARDAEALLALASRHADEPPPPVSPPVAAPAPPAVEGESLPAYLPISSALVGRLGHPATVAGPLQHLQASGLKTRETLRWLLEAAAWRLVFDDLPAALEALHYLQGPLGADPQVLALLAAVNERLGREGEVARLRGELGRLSIRVPQALLERSFRVETPAATAVTRYTERDEAVGERHARLEALLAMVQVLQVAPERPPTLAATYEENLIRLRQLARLLDD